jgi:site-specific DNA-methyltransferase (cytosine-N4-specific)
MTEVPSGLTPLVLGGHVTDVLRAIPDEVVQSGITSPPYWGARSYVACTCSVAYQRKAEEKGSHPHRTNPPRTRLIHPPDPSCPKCGGTGRLLSIQDPVWGGDPKCEHVWAKTPPRRHRKPDDASGELQRSNLGASYEATGGQMCEKCGGWRGMLGDEPTPQMFVDHLLEPLTEFRRVLRPDGVLWLNLGDSRTTHPAGNAPERRWEGSWMVAKDRSGAEQAGAFDKRRSGIPEKNLAGVPWRVAFALQDRGWFLRSAVVWNKRNPGRNSSKDRPCDSHEYIFMLTKNPRYYYDDSAVRQPYAEETVREIAVAYRNVSTGLYERNKAQNPSDTKRRIIERLAQRGGSTLPDVWTFATSSYEGEHYATFPPELPRICIGASTRPGDLVMDFFAGSGTTLVVSREMGRRSIGIDINPEYVRQAIERAGEARTETVYHPAQTRLTAFAEAA